MEIINLCVILLIINTINMFDWFIILTVNLMVGFNPVTFWQQKVFPFLRFSSFGPFNVAFPPLVFRVAPYRGPSVRESALESRLLLSVNLKIQDR